MNSIFDNADKIICKYNKIKIPATRFYYDDLSNELDLNFISNVSKLFDKSSTVKFYIVSSKTDDVWWFEVESDKIFITCNAGTSLVVPITSLIKA